MANKEAKYDKVLLTLAALAALGVSGSLYVFKSSFAEKLVQPKVTPKQDFGEIPMEAVTSAMTRLQQPFEWTAPVRQNKPVPLNKSVTVVMKENQLFDLFLENPPLRPPMTNKFLRDYDLEYLSANVGDLDPDGDGFTNLEEFTAGTKPNDAKDHPPLTNHLYFKSRIQKNYIMVLQSSDMPIQVKRNEPAPARSVFVDTLPKDFGFEAGGSTPRFLAEKFEKKELKDPNTGIGKDVSELTVLDHATNQKFSLVYKTPFNLADFEVELEFRDKTVQTQTVKKGDKFRLSGVGSTFRVIDIADDNATIVEEGTGAKFVVNKRP